MPQINNKPFIFSCYVLSIDGKLYYQDIKSGFSITKSNSHATDLEKKADLFTLMLARTISDAIVVGTNSINYESGNYLPDISDSELLKMREQLQKPQFPTTIVICRDLSNINFKERLFNDSLHPVIICCSNEQINLANLPKSFAKLDLNDLTNKEQLQLKNLVYIDNWSRLINKLYTIGFNIILNESPYFHHQLLELKLLDEIWLNYSGSYVGGSLIGLGGRQAAFDSKNHPDCEILTLHNLAYNFLYTRQKNTLHLNF